MHETETKPNAVLKTLPLSGTTRPLGIDREVESLMAGNVTARTAGNCSQLKMTTTPLVSKRKVLVTAFNGMELADRMGERQARVRPLLPPRASMENMAVGSTITTYRPWRLS